MWDMKTIEWIDIELTSYCNLACPGCMREQLPYLKPHLNKDLLSLDSLKQWIKKEDLPNLKLINFCGSVDEPTSHPEFFEIIEYFKTFGLHINVSTNGSLRTPKWWAELAKILPEQHTVIFGIDGVGKLSEKYRVGSNVKKVTNNCRSFIRSGGQAVWQFILFDWNEHQLEDAKKLAVEEGFSKFRVVNSHRKTFNEKQTVKEELGEIECAYGKQKRIFLGHTGEVLPCCHFNSETLKMNLINTPSTNYGKLYEKHGKTLSTNLKFQHISEIIEGDLFKDVVKSWNETPLHKCEVTCRKRIRSTFDDITIPK